MTRRPRPTQTLRTVQKDPLRPNNQPDAADPERAVNKMIDFNLLCNILSPGIFVILAGGLITGYDTATLIVIGVIGYSLVFLMRRLAKRQRKQ